MRCLNLEVGCDSGGPDEIGSVYWCQRFYLKSHNKVFGAGLLRDSNGRFMGLLEQKRSDHRREIQAAF